MNYIPPTFKAVSVVFACSAVFTGAQAIVDPVGFSRSFGILITAVEDTGKPRSSTTSPFNGLNRNPATSYVSLMGVRQLATGITLLTFAYQGNWEEMATILAILGIVVAGTDGIYLSRSGAKSLAKFHAIPGSLIALLAIVFNLTSS